MPDSMTEAIDELSPSSRPTPDAADITVLVRPGRRADAAARLAREVIKNDCFDRLREDCPCAEDTARRARQARS